MAKPGVHIAHCDRFYGLSLRLVPVTAAGKEQLHAHPCHLRQAESRLYIVKYTVVLQTSGRS